MQETTKTHFGVSGLSKPTPKWAVWAFRVFFYVTATVSLYLLIFTKIPAETKLTISQHVIFLNLAVHGLTRLLGIEIKEEKFYPEQNI